MGASEQSWTLKLKESLPWLGFSIYLAWPFVFFYSVVALPAKSSFIDLTISTFLSALAFSLTLIVLAIYQTRVKRIAVGGRPLYLAGILVAVGILLGTLASYAPQATWPALMYSAGILTGIGSSFVMAQYAVLYSQIDDRKISVLFSACYLIAALTYFIFIAIPEPLAQVLLIALPLVPLHSLNSHLDQTQTVESTSPQETDRQATKSLMAPLLKSLASVFVFGLVFGYQRGFMTSGIGEDAWANGIVFFVAMGLFAVAFGLFCWLKKEPVTVTGLYKLAAIVMAVGLLCFTYAPDNGESIGSVCIAAANIAFDISVLIGLSSYARRSRERSLTIFSFGFASSHMGMAVGVLLGLAANMLGGASNQTAQAITAVVELLILVAAMFTFSAADPTSAKPKEAADMSDSTPATTPTSPDKSPDTPGPSPRPRAEACERLANDYGLSKREREVLALMLEGRNMPYIENELCISESTVKTHKRHIYDKLGVHSLQEVLDMADEIEGRG